MKKLITAVLILAVEFIVQSVTMAQDAEGEKENPEIKAVIDKGVQGLLSMNPRAHDSGLYLYTLKKMDIKPDNPKFTQSLNMVLAKFNNGVYKPTAHHIYESAIDCIALEAVDGVKYKTNLEAIVKYVQGHQMENGGWYYIVIPTGAVGDTSMMQFAMLIYWNAARAGVEIDGNSLNKAAKWLITYQESNGSYFYEPNKRQDGPRLTMTSAGAGSLGIIRLLFYGDRAAKQEKTLGVLTEAAPLGASNPFKVNGKPDYKSTELDSNADKAIAWFTSNYDETSNPKYFLTMFKYYYLYTLERMTAIHNLKSLGSHDWYMDGFSMLKKNQSNNGTWLDGYKNEEISDTCFALLFLKKATNKQLKRDQSVGGGLLVGGRGLPDNLSDVTRQKNGGVKAKQSLGSMDDLLAALEKTEIVDLDATQQSIVETVQLGKPEELIGQHDKLLKLADNKDPGVRKTALWALSRCSILEDAGIFVKSIEDPDLEVAIEARNGLCWLSRQIKGLGEPSHPSNMLNKNEEWDSVSDQRRIEVAKKWRVEVKTVWEKWYFKNRPYTLRDDLFEPAQKDLK